MGADDRRLIRPEDLTDFVPMRQTAASPTEGWNGVSLRSFRTLVTESEVPPLRDYSLVLYRMPPFLMQRRLHGKWTSATVGRGSVSLLTRGAEARWRWEGLIDVTNIYLTPRELLRVGEQMFDRDVDDVELVDRLDADDPMLFRAVNALCGEAARGGPGGRLLVDSLRTELAVRILRRHAHVRFRETDGPGGLSSRQAATVRDYVRDNLGSDLSLDDLAASVSLSRFHFSRTFRRSFGMSPHEYVLQQRLACARRLVESSVLPLRRVAVESGFADQSHMTRVFRERLGTTPAAHRAATRR